MRRRGVVAALAFLFVAGALGAFVQPARAGDPTGAYGGSLNVALQGFTSTDPLLASSADKAILTLIYDQLGRVDPVSLRMTPWAASGWEWDGDKNITVALRPDLTWSDGTAYDADDVLYSFGRYMRGGVPRWTIARVDAYTLRFDFTGINTATWNYETTNEAGPGLFWTEALTASIAWAQGSTQLRYSGPFAVSSYTPGSRLVLAANEYYHSGRPFLDSITYMWPYTINLDPATGNTTATDAGCALMLNDVHMIGWPLLTNDLTNTRDCQAGWGGFPGKPADWRESILSTDLNRTAKHVLAAKNPGNDFLYFGFAQNGGSLFVGAPGTDGQKLRSAIYQFVNKLNYRDVEPNSAISHTLVSRIDTPWAPTNCPPFTPCAVAVDAGFTGTGTAKKTDSSRGVLALTLGGLVDRNGDGTRETSAGVPISFRILAPSFTLDPRKTTISGDMEFLLRAAGLDVTTLVYDSWAALDAAISGCTTSCMYVRRYQSATTLPDWLMAMPEVRAANDPDVDLHLNLGGATSYSAEDRAHHVGHANHYVGANADVLPILHFDTLEAFDFEVYDGWVNMFGGINNFWSFTHLRLPAIDMDGDGVQDTLAARLSIFPTRSLGPGDMTDVQVEVRDAIGLPVAGVEVELSASLGTFTAATGTTDGNGIYLTEYLAPATIAQDEDVTVSAMVTMSQYTGSGASGTLTLHKPGAGSLQVAVARADPEIASGESTDITVQVRDGTGTALAGASVVLWTDLPGATIAPASGTTDASGLFTATITADVVQGMTYKITADVTKAGYGDDSGSASLVVQPRIVEPTKIDVTKNVPGFEAMAAVGAIAVVFALVALARRRED